MSRSATTRAPVETSTFLFTDIEGSTRLWDDHVDEMGMALAQHDRLLRDAIEPSGGTVIKTTGDGMLAVFADPVAAVDAALAAQRNLRAATWGATGELRVRMALHSGVAEVRDGDYFGPALNRTSRILAIGHGGQIICSAVTAVLAGERLPSTIEMIDLGSHRLRDIDRPERVYQVVVADLPRTFPPLRSLSTRRSNLPVPLTSFVGRDKELAEVATLLERHRLVTVVGTGGTGKTRLMLEAAGRILDRFPDGVWLAELAPLGDPAQIPSEVARALGAPELPGVPATATVTAFVADKELLLLLDNAEHLVDGTAAFAERLLAGAPGLRILATSREALAVSGEAVLPLQSLSCPRAEARSTAIGGAVEVEDAASTEAVQLFTQRAAAVDPAFTLGRSNVAAVGEICRRVDGIPLAIELAAARVSAMSPDEIATRLGDRFRLLTGGRRTAVPRQQTLHALIDWSWDLLTEEDRRLLRRLSVFVGGWTVPMAAQIVGDDPTGMDSLDLIDGLTRLVDRSLVTVDRDTMRYRMLETIRQYAREQLVAAGEAAAVADRHLAVFAALASESEAPLRGPHMVDWLDRLDAELDNLGVALEWALEAEPWKAVGMAASLLPYWAVRVMSQDNDARIEAAVEFARKSVIGRPDVEPREMALTARLLGEAARLWGMSGRGTVAYGWAEDAIRLAEESGDATARLSALAGLGIATVFTGRSGTGGTHFRRLFEEASDLAEELGQWWLLAISASFAGASLASFDADGDAALLLRRGVDAARRSGSPYAIGSASMAQGRAFGREGDTDGAIAAFAIAIQRFTEIGDDRFVLACRSDLAHALRRGGRFEQALTLYRETIPAWVRLGHKGAIANQLENVAYVLVARDDYEAAVRLLGAADAIREAADAHMAFDEEPEHTTAKDRLHDVMTSSAYADGWAAGCAMSQTDAVALAISA